MKSEEQLKLPGGSMAWWETAQDWRTPPPKCPWNTRTNVHLWALLLRSSIIPFPSFIRKRMSRKQKRREVKEEGGAQIALLLTSFLCIPNHVSTTFKVRQVKHFSPHCPQNAKYIQVATFFLNMSENEIPSPFNTSQPCFHALMSNS